MSAEYDAEDEAHDGAEVLSGPDVRERIRSLERALELRPDDVPAWLDLARQFLKLSAELSGEALSDQRGPALEEAIRATEEALVREPTSLHALRLLSKAQADLGVWQAERGIDPELAWQSAMRACETIIRRRPADPEPHRRIAWCSFWFGIDLRDRDRNPHDALLKAAAAQTQAMLLDPTNMVDTHMLRLFHSTIEAVEADRAGRKPPDPERFREAPLRVWRRQVRRAPFDPEVRARLGIVELSDSMHQARTCSTRGALRTFGKALRLDRNHFGALFASGVTHRYLAENRDDDDWGEEDESRRHRAVARHARAAVAALRRAARIQPDHQRVWAELGRAALLLGRSWGCPRREMSRALRLARAAYDRALELDPDDLEARSGLGNALFQTGVLLHMGERDATGAFEEAARVHAEAMRREPERSLHLSSYSAALEWLAKETLRLGDDARQALLRSINVLETIVERDPKDSHNADVLAELWFHLAKARAEAGEDASDSYAKAIELHRERIRHEPDGSYPRTLLANVGESYAHWLERRGADPEAGYEIAIRILEVECARGREWERSTSLDRIARLWTALTQWQDIHGRDARAALAAAIDAQRRRLALPNTYRWMHFDLANALGGMARWLQSRGHDPSEPHGEWVSILERLHAEEPPSTLLGGAWLDLARFEVDRGGNAERPLQAALEIHAHCAEHPHDAGRRRDWDACVGLAAARLLQAQIGRGGGEDARELLLSVLHAIEGVPLERRKTRSKRRTHASDLARDCDRIRLGRTIRALSVRGEALLALGRPGDARRCFERALASDPDNGPLRRLLERARELTRKPPPRPPAA